MKKWTLPAFASVVLFFAIASIVRTQPVQERHDPPLSPPRSSFDKQVAAVGLVEASSENISIGSHLPGVVEKVFVHVGEQVHRGDPLVKLDTRALEASLAQVRATLGVRTASLKALEARAKASTASLADVQRLLRIAEGTDPRSISVEEVTRRRSAVEIAEANRISAGADVDSAKAELLAAEASVNSVETEIARSTVTAPIDAQVLQVKIRPGEFAPAGATTEAWMLLGNTAQLHVRVDVDEHEAWRVTPESHAVAQVRGNAALSSPLVFVRFEPYVLPKKSLTGDAVERVDTRVLQVVYRIENRDLRLFVGQQMDVFIEAKELPSTAARADRKP